MAQPLPRGSPTPTTAGFVVQRNAPPGVPVSISSLEDPLFGPVVSFSLAGPLTEMLADRSYRIPPLSGLDAADMVREVKNSPLLFGYRGSEVVDVEAARDRSSGSRGCSTTCPRCGPWTSRSSRSARTAAAVLNAAVRVEPVARPALGLVRRRLTTPPG